jgi:hypothetical protein
MAAKASLAWPETLTSNVFKNCVLRKDADVTEASGECANRASSTVWVTRSTALANIVKAEARSMNGGLDESGWYGLPCIEVGVTEAEGAVEEEESEDDTDFMPSVIEVKAAVREDIRSCTGPLGGADG